MFAAIKNNKNGLCSLFHKKKFHKETSIVVDHILAYFLKLYREGVLIILDPCYQDIAIEAKWTDNQLYYEEELELNEAIKDDVDLEQITKEKPTAKKRVRIYEEDDATMASYNTSDYVINSK